MHTLYERVGELAESIAPHLPGQWTAQRDGSKTTLTSAGGQQIILYPTPQIRVGFHLVPDPYPVGQPVGHTKNGTLSLDRDPTAAARHVARMALGL